MLCLARDFYSHNHCWASKPLPCGQAYSPSADNFALPFPASVQTTQAEDKAAPKWQLINGAENNDLPAFHGDNTSRSASAFEHAATAAVDFDLPFTASVEQPNTGSNVPSERYQGNQTFISELKQEISNPQAIQPLLREGKPVCDEACASQFEQVSNLSSILLINATSSPFAAETSQASSSSSPSAAAFFRHSHVINIDKCGKSASMASSSTSPLMLAATAPAASSTINPHVSNPDMCGNPATPRVGNLGSKPAINRQWQQSCLL